MANNTSNLLVEAHRPGPADLLIASAWSHSRLGSAMLRLHSEWDAAQKPRKPTPETINALAVSMGREHAYKTATAWFEGEILDLMGRLHTLGEVRAQVAVKAADWRISDPEIKAAAVVKFWLDQTCHPCAGLRFRPIPNAPALSNKVCPTCSGSGLSQVPYGAEGKRLANYMDDCVQRARTSIKKRLHNSRVV